ncbi:MAG: hypothetical protein ABSD43_12520 [Terracidiphilus sp.]
MRIEILKRVRELEERVHLLGGVLATLFVITLAAEYLRTRNEAPEGILLEVLHWVLIAADVLIFLLFVGTILFRYFGLAKTSRTWWRATQDKELNRKIQDWFAADKGDQPLQTVRFCSESCFEDLCQLNYDAFKDTVFAVEKEKLQRRNAEWLRRNRRIFMLILDPFNPDRYIGYSAMLPLTHEGMHSYLDGALKDADIPASLVARDRAATGGVLIFAIYLKEEFSFQKSQASRNYSIYFLACVRRHAQVLYPKGPGQAGQYPPIYVQTEHAAIRKRLDDYGFVATKKRSADGFDILVLEHPFRHAGMNSTPQFLAQDLPQELTVAAGEYPATEL